MPSAKLTNYLRTYRKRAGFTQNEIAFLLGCKSGTKLSRYEQFNRLPKIETVFACEAIFRVPSRDLFAGIFHEVEKAIKARARKLARRLGKKTIDATAVRKLEALLAISSGVSQRDADQL